MRLSQFPGVFQVTLASSDAVVLEIRPFEIANARCVGHNKRKQN